MAEYKQTKRRFHDAWAFILYLIFTMSLNGYYIATQKDTMKFSMPDTKLLIALAGFYVGFISLIMLLLVTIPKELMHFSFIVSPFAYIGFAIYYNAYTLAIVSAVIMGAFILGMYFFVYKKNIKYSAAIAKETTKIVAKNGISISLAFVVAITMSIAQFGIAFNYMFNDVVDKRLALALFTLQVYWTFFVFLYAFRVFVSTVVGLECLTHRNISHGLESAKNTMFCLGSIALGALIIALVKVGRALNNQSRRDRDRGLLAVVFQIIIAVILMFLEAIIRTLNDWLYVYMALYGKNYTDSLKESFDVICRGNNNILVNSVCILPCLSVFTLLGMFSFGALLQYIHPAITQAKEIHTLIIMAIFFFQFAEIFCTCIEASMLSFLFVHDKDPVAIKVKYPKCYDVMEEQVRKNVGVV